MAGLPIAFHKQRERSVSPRESTRTQMLQPIAEGAAGDGEIDYGDEDKQAQEDDDENEIDELAKKYEDLKDKVEEHFDDENGKHFKAPPVVKSPPQPTREELERHQATHTPFAAWCKHCIAARAVRHRHPSKGRKARIVPDIETGKGPIKVSLDYMYLHERQGKYRESACNPPHMIVIDHKHGRCWAYRVPNKGILEEAHWLPERIVQDLDNIGLGHERIQLKTDQEPAIVTVQRTIQELRPGIIPTNSPVGESECNGRIENTIRRVQEKIRARRHQVEQGMKEKIPDEAPIMSWLVRWVAEPVSKYSPRDDGRTLYERVRFESCAVPLVPFGETVMYLPLTATSSKGDPAKKQGVWLGTIERIEEAIIGTTRGIVKRRIVSRLPPMERWNMSLILEMVGVPWETISGRQSAHIPVEATDNGCEVQLGDEDTRAPDVDDDEDDEAGVKLRGSADIFHVSKKAINKYGTTLGRPACKEID